MSDSYTIREDKVIAFRRIWRTLLMRLILQATVGAALVAVLVANIVSGVMDPVITSVCTISIVASALSIGCYLDEANERTQKLLID